MHAKLFLVPGTITSLTNPVIGQGFDIPQNQTDSVYVVSTDAEGNLVDDVISRDLNEKPAVTSATLPISSKRCKTATLTNLVDQLGSFCGTGSGKDVYTIGVYSIAGGAAAYICNYTSGRNPCSREELNQMVKKMGDLCLDNQASRCLPNLS